MVGQWRWVTDLGKFILKQTLELSLIFFRSICRLQMRWLVLVILVRDTVEFTSGLEEEVVIQIVYLSIIM